jgi:hypothetical protein
MRLFHHSLLAEIGQCIYSEKIVFQYSVKGLTGGYQTLALDTVKK